MARSSRFSVGYGGCTPHVKPEAAGGPVVPFRGRCRWRVLPSLAPCQTFLQSEKQKPLEKSRGFVLIGFRRLGYAHWPELRPLTRKLAKCFRRLGYAHWLEHTAVGVPARDTIVPRFARFQKVRSPEVLPTRSGPLAILQRVLERPPVYAILSCSGCGRTCPP